MQFRDVHGNRMYGAWRAGWQIPRRLVLALAIGLLSVAAVTQIDLTTQVKNILPVANGGTNAGTFSAHNWFGNNSGSTGAPSASAIGAADLVGQYVAGAGTAQAQTATLSPAVPALAAGLSVFWKPNAANSGAGPTLAVNGLTATTIVKIGGASLAANDLTTTAIAWAIYDGTNFELQNPQTASGGSGTVSNCSVANSVGYFSATGTTVSCISEAALSQYLYGAAGGSAQAQTLTLAPALASLATGIKVWFKPYAANTAAAPTLAINSTAATAITKCGATALVANDLSATALAEVIYDGTEYQLLNPQAVPCGAMSSGGATGNFADNTTPTGTCPTTNLTLAHAPNPAASLNLFDNGQLLTAGGADYTLASSTITLVNSCPSGSVFIASYRY